MAISHECMCVCVYVICMCVCMNVCVCKYVDRIQDFVKGGPS